MRIGIYASDPGQMEVLPRELADHTQWVAGPDLTGAFAYPVYANFAQAMADSPVDLVIDCLGGLQEEGVPVIPARVALFLVRAGKDRSVTAPQSAFSTASAQLRGALEKVMDRLGLLSGYSERLSKVGAELSATSKEITGDLERTGGILDSISRIAKRSKIIGLNSAIEAARVGEQGRGFAVVAEEIKSLADDSAQSIQGIERILAGIKQYSGEFTEGTSSIGELSDLQQRATTDILAMLQSLKELGQHLELLATDEREESLLALPSPSAQG